MEAYKLTFVENQSGYKSEFSVTAYSKDQVEKSKRYHAEKGNKLVKTEDISVK